MNVSLDNKCTCNPCVLARFLCSFGQLPGQAHPRTLDEQIGGFHSLITPVEKRERSR